MIDPALKDFVIAIVGASASFIGLLFVAISFVLTDDGETPASQRLTRRILAESSYAALINIFFVGLVALVPHARLGYVIVATAWTGLGGSWHFMRAMKRGADTRYSRSLLTLSYIIYLQEMVYGLYLLTRPDGYVVNGYVFTTPMLVLFGMALTRAWELTGIRDHHRPPRKP